MGRNLPSPAASSSGQGILQVSMGPWWICKSLQRVSAAKDHFGSSREGVEEDKLEAREASRKLLQLLNVR